MKNEPSFLRLFCAIIILGAISFACRLPSNLPILSPSETPTFTPTPLPTSTPSPTSTPTLIPTPSLAPTQRIASGDKALFNGNWDEAMDAYRTARETSADSALTSSAVLGIGKTQFLQGDSTNALLTIREFLEKYPESPHAAESFYFLGQILTRLERYNEGADAYLKYIEINPGIIDSHIYTLRGDALFAAGDYLAAFDSYQAAIKAPHLGGDTNLQINSARALAGNGDYETAFSLFDQVYQNTSDSYTKAEINWLRGQIYNALGDFGYAHVYYYESVANFPQSYYTYLGLIELVESGVPVDEYSRGLIDYYAGQYALAVSAFDRYLLSTPEHLAETHYYKGLALREIGEYETAIQEWDEFLKLVGLIIKK